MQTAHNPVPQNCSRWCCLAVSVLLTCGGCQESATPVEVAETPVDVIPHSNLDPLNFAELEAIDERAGAIRQFCGDCHATPLPQSFPKDAWYQEVRRGFDFYHKSGRTDLSVPIPAQVAAFYQQYAPAAFDLPQAPETQFSDVQFVAQEIRLSFPGVATPPAVSFLDVRNQSATGPEIWFSDMRSGSAGQVLLTADPTGEAPTVEAELTISRHGVADHPAAVRTGDLDDNGTADLIFCDLGSFLPEDHDRGQLIWLPDGTGADPKAPVVLLSDVGRIADVAVADFSGDGWLDLVIAEFGWHGTGGIHLLVNQGDNSDQPTFQHQQLDQRPGTIHVLPTDLDQDGRLDFLALISQEYEVLTAFMNRADGFQQVLIYAAPDPSWGSSGIAVADLNADGKPDILYTNGDTFDSNLIKPYHGITWLKNIEPLKFEPQQLGPLPGVHRALPCDVDGDGDLDIVAAALLPSGSSRNTDPNQLQSLIWLEQTQPEKFIRHIVETGRPMYAAIQTADVNGDQRPDIIAGCFHEDGPSDSPLLKVFLNTAASSQP